MEERRKTKRIRTFLGGRLTFNKRCSVLDCVVRNLSPEGAMISVDQATALPDRVDLTILQKARNFEARTVWRRANQAGVAFLPR